MAGGRAKSRGLCRCGRCYPTGGGKSRDEDAGGEPACEGQKWPMFQAGRPLL